MGLMFSGTQSLMLCTFCLSMWSRITLSDGFLKALWTKRTLMPTWQKCHGPEVHITINKHLHLGSNSGQQKSVFFNKPVDKGVDSTGNGRYDYIP